MAKTRRVSKENGDARPSRSSTRPSRPVINVVDLDSGTETETETEQSWETGDEWEVEQVIGKQHDEHGRLSYHLKWKNWHGEPTWEPKANCRCHKLIKEYEQKLGEESTPPVRSSGRHAAIPSTSNGHKSTDSPSSSPSQQTSRVRFKKTPKRGSRI